MYPYQHPNSALNGGGANMTTAAAAEWSWRDNKTFEDALVKFPAEFPNRFQRIAGCLPGKSPHDVMQHYETLQVDVADIEAGRVQLPNYPELPKPRRSSSPPLSSGDRKSQCERKKGKPWTVREHKLFLRGLKMYGNSDWRSISRNVVVTRLPSQVASHAQKFFNRHKPAKKERKRSSIHDITSFTDIDMDFPYFNNAAAASDCAMDVSTVQHNIPIKEDRFQTAPAPAPYQSFSSDFGCDPFQM